MHAYRTHNCGELREAEVGGQVRLSGWVHRKRDHGNLLFVDLRDHHGITQIVTDVDDEAFKALESVRVELVVTVTGKVVRRAADAVNPNLPTGEIEIHAEEVAIQSAAQELPLPVFGEQDYPEEIRLRYRYLDLRRERLHANIVLRSQVIASIRRRMIDSGFTEFQTPILTASSPEGARDYLVPSRVHPGKFYALPQAPQMFKQLIMVAGFDRYFQIAPCFRDEDARADRSPGEFYQLDFEMSFVTQDDVFEAIEPVLAGVFEEFANGKSVTPAGQFPRIPYKEAMLKYGSDKPDLRNPILISRRLGSFPRLGLRPVRPHRRRGRRGPRHSGAGHGREEPQILRRHERMGALGRPCRPRLHHPEGRRTWRTDRQESRRGGDAQADRRAGPRPRRRPLLRRRQGRRRRPSSPARPAPGSPRNSA